MGTHRDPLVVASHLNGRLTFSLPPGYNPLKGEAYIYVDQRLMEAIGHMVSEIPGVKIVPGGLEGEVSQNVTWDSVLLAITQCPSFEPVPDSPPGRVEDRHDTYVSRATRGISNFWKAKTSILKASINENRSEIIEETAYWFRRLKIDEDVRDCAILDVATIVDNQADHILSVLSNGNSGRDSDFKQKHTFLDIGFIRFPDFMRPRIKVYRFQLATVIEISGRGTTLKSSMEVEYQHREFQPRDDFLATFKRRAMAIARENAYKCLGISVMESPKSAIESLHPEGVRPVICVAHWGLPTQESLLVPPT